MAEVPIRIQPKEQKMTTPEQRKVGNAERVGVAILSTAARAEKKRMPASKREKQKIYDTQPGRGALEFIADLTDMPPKPKSNPDALPGIPQSLLKPGEKPPIGNEIHVYLNQGLDVATLSPQLPGDTPATIIRLNGKTRTANVDYIICEVNTGKGVELLELPMTTVVGAQFLAEADNIMRDGNLDPQQLTLLTTYRNALTGDPQNISDTEAQAVLEAAPKNNLVTREVITKFAQRYNVDQTAVNNVLQNEYGNQDILEPKAVAEIIKVATGNFTTEIDTYTHNIETVDTEISTLPADENTMVPNPDKTPGAPPEITAKERRQQLEQQKNDLTDQQDTLKKMQEQLTAEDGLIEQVMPYIENGDVPAERSDVFFDLLENGADTPEKQKELIDKVEAWKIADANGDEEAIKKIKEDTTRMRKIAEYAGAGGAAAAGILLLFIIQAFKDGAEDMKRMH